MDVSIMISVPISQFNIEVINRALFIVFLGFTNYPRFLSASLIVMIIE